MQNRNTLLPKSNSGTATSTDTLSVALDRPVRQAGSAAARRAASSRKDWIKARRSARLAKASPSGASSIS